MSDLITSTQESIYDAFCERRAAFLAQGGEDDSDPMQKAKKALASYMMEDEENLRIRFTEQVSI